MRRRVLVVATSYPADAGDPAGHFVRAEVDELTRLGERVVVVAPGKPGRTGDNPEILRVEDGGAFGWPGVLSRLRQRPHRALGVVRFVLGAKRTIAALGPFDRVVAHWVVPSAWPIAADVAAPLEVVAHGSDVRLLEAIPGARLVVGWLHGRARFRFVSSELRDRFTRVMRLSFDDAVVRPCAIDTSGVPPRRGARTLLGLSDEERCAVIVGRLVPSKRVGEAIELALPRSETIVVIGDGPERARLEARFPRVRFVGALPRPDTLTWIAAADLLVSASPFEGAPTAIREARALGTTVLSVHAGDVAAWAASDPGIELVR